VHPARSLSALLTVACVVLAFGAGSAAAKTTDAMVQKGLQELVAMPGGPPGAIATLYRNGELTTLSAGHAAIETEGKPQANEHMRIASVSKAFNGAVALHLVGEGKLSLTETIGKALPKLPKAWRAVTLGELLRHTSGLPNYTSSKGFSHQTLSNRAGFVSPAKIIKWVAKQPLAFKPGSRYEYSNTDNIVVALMVEAATQATYENELQQIVLGPAQLTQTTLPTTVTMPTPFIHGYFGATEMEPEQDVSEYISPSGAWASGGIVSTPEDLNAFIRDDLGLKFFGSVQQQAQMNWWPGGESSPPGPGKNSAGLGLFRYRTRCGTVYGHTGSFPGYTQFAAATADGSRAVTTTISIPAPAYKLRGKLMRVETEAVCDLLGK
jgi:D-alanyl-D-alanine carboxypeptidase